MTVTSTMASNISSGNLSGMVFCITGSLSVLRREFESLLKQHGAEIRPRVTQAVTHLICSDTSTSKAVKARQMNIDIISEDAVRQIISSNQNASILQTTNHHQQEIIDMLSDDDDDDDDEANQAAARPSSTHPTVQAHPLAHAQLGQGIWEYYVDDNVDGKRTQWYAYDPEANRLAEELYGFYLQDPQMFAYGELDMGNLGFSYRLDFRNMTQTNIQHANQSRRRIRRRIHNNNYKRSAGATHTVAQPPSKKAKSTITTTTPTTATKSTSNNPTNAAATMSSSSTATTTTAKTELADGEEFTVPGKEYKIKNVGGVYSCTCPGWRFQSQKTDVRTCKHIKELRGELAEKQRLAENGASSVASTATTKSYYKKSCATAGTKGATAGSGTLWDASNLTLAHKWDPSKNNKNPSDFLMSEKLDGMRALWNGVQLVSRQGNPIDAPDFFVLGFPANVALDGELFMGRGQFQATVSITRRQNGGDLWRKIKFVVFDAPTVAGGFEERLQAARKVVDTLEFAEILEHKPCRDHGHLDEELKRIEKLGGEGVMMREKGSTYQTGRTQKLLKVKTFVDDEGLVYGHEPGKGKHTGRLGALLCRLRNGTTFKVGTGFTDSQRENPPPIGAVVTVKYFELTNAGVPRFPTFQRIRVDVDASEFAS